MGKNLIGSRKGNIAPIPIIFLTSLLDCLLAHRLAVFRFCLFFFGLALTIGLVLCRMTKHPSLPNIIIISEQLLFFLSFLKIWSLFTVCISFRCIARWFSYMYIYYNVLYIVMCYIYGMDGMEKLEWIFWLT